MKISMATSPTTGVVGTAGVPSAIRSSKSAAGRVILFILLLICSLAIVFMGANYSKLFPTNGNLIYAIVTSGVFLSAALGFKYTPRLNRYWPITYAFFIAAVINLVSILFAPYTSDILRWLGASEDLNMTAGIDKVYDSLLVVIPVIGLTWLSGSDLGSLLLRKGNLQHKWGWGIGLLILVNYFTSVLMFYGTGYSLPSLGSAVLWGLVFSFSNSMLEELWVRGIFFKKLIPLIGGTGAILLTSTVFAALHFHSVAFMPAFAVPIFVINTFTMGIACGILMLKTESIWGAFLIHAAADLFLFIAMLAAR